MKITTVAILGGHIQALGLARQVKAHGEKVIVISDDKCSVARWSRDVDEFINYKDKSELILIIESLSPLDSRLSPNTMLFPTSDDYIDLMVEHYNEWKDKLYLAIPSPETVALFANKRTTYQFCEQNNIAHPHSFYPNNLDDLREIAKQIDYPCVVKPGVMYLFHKLLGKKAFLIGDRRQATGDRKREEGRGKNEEVRGKREEGRGKNIAELINKMQEIQDRGFPIDLMVVQEFMSGGAKDLYSFGTFAVDGESLVDIQVNRIRQNPMTFGNSTTYCHTVHVPEIEQEAKRILKLTHFTGMGEVEFMYDKGEYKFLEINTRAWKWHTITNQLHFSFIAAWLDYLGGKSEEVRGKNEEVRGKDAAWVERLTDTAVVMKEILHRRMKISDYCKTMCRIKESAVWSWRDPLPAIMYVILSPILYIKRY